MMEATCQEKLARRVCDLGRLLDEARDLYDQLATVIDAKVAAIRRADWSELCACTGRERSITERIAVREGLRRQLLDAIGVELGMLPRMGRTMSVSELARRLSPDVASSLTVAAERLRPVLAKAAQANRVAGFAARGVLHHVRWIVETVLPYAEGGSEYRDDGAVPPRSGAVLFETLG